MHRCLFDHCSCDKNFIKSALLSGKAMKYFSVFRSESWNVSDLNRPNSRRFVRKCNAWRNACLAWSGITLFIRIANLIQISLTIPDICISFPTKWRPPLSCILNVAWFNIWRRMTILTCLQKFDLIS